MHRMTRILLAERVASDAEVLVLGAGGGLELKALAEAEPRWALRWRRSRRGDAEAGRADARAIECGVQLQQGYIDDAPDRPFDAATCLLTLHFLDVDERRRTAREIHRRLKPGAPFVAAHSSFPQASGERARWLSRYAAYAIASGADPDQDNSARAAVDASLNLLSPEQDAQILREAGFRCRAVLRRLYLARLGWLRLKLDLASSEAHICLK